MNCIFERVRHNWPNHLLKRGRPSAIKTEGKQLVIFLSVRRTGKRSMAVVVSLATTMALAGIKGQLKKRYYKISAFETSAKNNFPHVTFPTKTTPCTPSSITTHTHISPRNSSAALHIPWQEGEENKSEQSLLSKRLSKAIKGVCLLCVEKWFWYSHLHNKITACQKRVLKMILQNSIFPDLTE